MPHTSTFKIVDPEILNSPSSHFDKPMDVLYDAHYSQEDKRRILTAWKEQAEELQRATGEGMGGGEPSRIEDVAEALDRLDDKTREKMNQTQMH